jgi:hypothetical protein
MATVIEATNGFPITIFENGNELIFTSGRI